MRRVALFLVVVPFLLLACGSSEKAVDGGGTDAETNGDLGPDIEPDLEPATVAFADSNLEACVREALAKPEGDLSPDDLRTLEQLECQDKEIATLDGLEFAENLTDLSFWENDIVDISALSEMTKLTHLQLGNNKIADIKPLAGLTALKRAGLAVNAIADLAALADLTELRWLNLDNNKIGAGQTKHLDKLTKLTWLTLEYNEAVPKAELEQLAARIKKGQVYRAFADLKQQPSPRLFETPADLQRLRGGVLIPRARADGEVRFVYQVGKQRYDGQRLYAGKIVQRGDRVYHQSAAGEVIIGERGKGGLRLCQGDYASVCQLSVGVKTGRAMISNSEPVISVTLSLSKPNRLMPIAAEVPFSSDDDLIDFALASPNQLDAGSCLYMSNTGAMEILLNQHTDPKLVAYDGPTDLSERFLMTASGEVPASIKRYSYSDVSYTYNVFKGSLLNKDYPFTAGYIKRLSTGQVVKAESTDPDAQFSCNYNWIRELPADWETKIVETPPVERTAIFIEPTRSEESVWNVALMNDDIVERIKYELRSKNAPVIVVYNHFLYWHASIVVGYDDNAPTDCAIVTQSLEYFKEKGATKIINKINTHMAAEGGCADKGVFYVRDSIYDGTADEPTYSYSNIYKFEKKYSARIVEHAYGWVKYLSNHAYTIHRR